MRNGWNVKTNAEAGCEARRTVINPDLQEFRNHPIFAGLDEYSARTLIESCSSFQYRAGSIIVPQGSCPKGLHVIWRGLVDLAHVDGDHECGVLLLSTGDLLLPASALCSEQSLVSARALTTTRLILIDAAAVNSVMTQSSALSNNLLTALWGQWRMAVRNILDLNCRTAAQRLASFLLRLVDLQPETGAPILPIAKRHLAARLGMTAETLSRMLQVVADNGVHLRGKTIIVNDRERAEAFCGPDPYPSRDERVLNVFAL